ncbi:hypothetical protein [Dactylosporangium cerinum]
MRRTALAGLRPRRLVPTAIAVVLAVGFVAGIMIFGDTTRAALLDEYARAARNVDVALTAAEGNRLPLSTVDEVSRVDGVTSTEGRMAEQAPLVDRQGRLVTEFGAPGHAIDVGDHPELRPFDLRTGQVPQAEGKRRSTPAPPDGPVTRSATPSRSSARTSSRTSSGSSGSSTSPVWTAATPPRSC